MKTLELLIIIEKASSALGCEVWTENFDSLLALVKEYIIDLWTTGKVKLHREPCSSQLRSGILGMALWMGGKEEVSLVRSVTQGE